jgi:uncharacterized protein YuzE
MTASFPYIQYDPEVDAAYIYLKEVRSGGVARTVCVDPIDIGGMVNLDLDDDGVIVGIEVIDASRKLPPELLTH